MRAILFLITVSALAAFACAKSPQRTKAVVLFGDSYTDQSRQHSIINGTFPGKDYQEVFPPDDIAGDGGVQWPWYLGLYGSYTIWNYAVGGAVCSNDLTPTFGFPDVIGGQADWFIQDHIAQNGTLDMNPQEFVVIVYIGTNDLGLGSFVTDDQPPTTSLASIAECQLQVLRNLHALGARRFILNALVPLQLTRLYAPTDAPTIYFPAPHNGTQWNKRIFNFVQTMNALLRGGVAALRDEWKGTDATVQMFDMYAFFTEMYENPERFFNGSAPANVTGHCHQCPDPNDFRQCGIGDCTLDERDSYMWWDELHPSEQTGRNLAEEIFKALNGRSKFLS
ncbi:hypothetical protein MKEN_00453000 [Mycena kentingensis (nom. inval.)]|nr:hypothetical protein MKEN_00453000 [Mycena kentingensis (nom. inval.)]